MKKDNVIGIGFFTVIIVLFLGGIAGSGNSPVKDWLRGIHNMTALSIWQKKDTDGLFISDNHLFLLEGEANNQAVVFNGQLFHRITETYFSENSVYYCVIPDKNYYLADESYPRLDLRHIEKILGEQMEGAISIDIENSLTLSDYYKTDPHWRQENIIDTANMILYGMGASGEIENNMWKPGKSITDRFRGSYARLLAFPVGNESMYCLSGTPLDSVKVTDYEMAGDRDVAVYQLDKCGKNDDYDVYLGGARALLELKAEGESSDDEKVLVLFRDSYGSSIVPLFMEEYDRIIMIDLRYITAEFAFAQINVPQSCDVLFLFCEQVLNSNSLKKG